MKDLIVKKVSQFKEEILDFTQKLISIPTINPPGENYLSCVEFIGEKLKENKIKYEIIKVPSLTPDKKRFPRYNLLAYFGKGNRTLHFHGHYDVVPAFDQDQFKPQIKNGKLYGRGSSDMKSGLALMIYVLKIIEELGITLNGRIVLSIVPDEETGGYFGTKYLFDNKFLTKGGIGMLMPEPTSGFIWNGNRGALSLKVILKGKSAHVSLEHQGINPFEKMIELGKLLLDYKKELANRKTKFRIKPEGKESSILMLGGTAQSGASFNVVPEECYFSLDRRFNPEEDLESQKKELMEIINKFARDKVKINLEILQEGNSSSTSKNDLLAQALSRAIREIKGETPEFGLCPGLCEVRYFINNGIPAFGYGPGLLAVSHGPEEYICLKDILNCTAIYVLTVLQVLGHSEKENK
ncbi:MAG: M20 family metallopeptidase [Candidatus Aminicenantia bacterium]